MKLWLEEKENKRDTYHQDDVLWGKGMTDMVVRVVAATERDQKEERKADTDGARLESSIHPDLTQTGGLEEPEARKHRQPGRQLKSMPMPKPKTNQTPKPNPVPALRPMPTVMLRAILAAKGAMTSAPTPTR